MYLNLRVCRGRTLSSTSCLSRIVATVDFETFLSNFSDPCKTSLRRVRRERLIAQTRSDQNRDFAFRAATERAQVEQDDSPSRNTFCVFYIPIVLVV